MPYTAEELLIIASNFDDLATDSLLKEAKGKFPFWLKKKDKNEDDGKKSDSNKVDDNDAKKKKLDPKAKVRNRGTACVPAERAKDKKDHFPINDIGQARNALARVHQYSSVPSWYNGSLKGLQSLVSGKVHAKYPSIGKADSGKKKKSCDIYVNESLLNKYAEDLYKQELNAQSPSEIEEWHNTPEGRAWHKTPEGQAWLKTPDGQAWQKTQTYISPPDFDAACPGRYQETSDGGYCAPPSSALDNAFDKMIKKYALVAGVPDQTSSPEDILKYLQNESPSSKTGQMEALRRMLDVTKKITDEQYKQVFEMIWSPDQKTSPTHILQYIQNMSPKSKTEQIEVLRKLLDTKRIIDEQYKQVFNMLWPGSKQPLPATTHAHQPVTTMYGYPSIELQKALAFIGDPDISDQLMVGARDPSKRGMDGDWGKSSEAALKLYATKYRLQDQASAAKHLMSWYKTTATPPSPAK
jgi:hypothetical protein